MSGDLYAAIAGFGSLIGSMKHIVDLHEAGARKAATYELIDKALSLQERYTALAEEVGALKTKLAEFEKWEAESQRYELKPHARGFTTYELKPDAQPPETPHSICPDCYQKGQKAILQPEHVAGGATLCCHACGWVKYTQGRAPAPNVPTGRR